MRNDFHCVLDKTCKEIYKLSNTIIAKKIISLLGQGKQISFGTVFGLIISSCKIHELQHKINKESILLHTKLHTKFFFENTLNYNKYDELIAYLSSLAWRNIPKQTILQWYGVLLEQDPSSYEEHALAIKEMLPELLQLAPASLMTDPLAFFHALDQTPSAHLQDRAKKLFTKVTGSPCKNLYSRKL